jgi:hypothetical protein
MDALEVLSSDSEQAEAAEPAPVDEGAEPPLSPLSLRYRFFKQSQRTFYPMLLSRGHIAFGFVAQSIFLILGVFFIIQFNQAGECARRYDIDCPLGQNPCQVGLDVPEELSGPIRFQYMLTNFYQNHRRFVFSRIPAQLRGEYVSYDDLSPAKPFRSIDDDPDPSKLLLPSGIFAMSVFNDTFRWLDNGTFWNESAIAYETEYSYLYQPLSNEYHGGVRWLEDSAVLGEKNMQDPHFITWMRTSAVPTLVKDYAVCENCTIPKGVYTIEINSSYPTDVFGGQKWIIITQRPLGGEFYLAVIFFVAWGASLAFACIFLVAELMCPREPGVGWRDNADDES